MTTLLQELRDELKTVFDRYDQTNHVTSVQNAECIAKLKNRVKTATNAFRLIHDLPAELKNLDTKFWSFLAFVDDPIRDLREGIENVLKQKKYERQNVLETESAELQEANHLLQERLTSLEEIIDRNKQLALPKKHINNSDSIPDQVDQDALETQLRAEIEQEIKEEVKKLEQQLSRERQETKRWQLKCDAYQKQTHVAVTEKEGLKQQLDDTQTKLTATEGKLSLAEAEITRLTLENQHLQKLVDAKEKNPFSSHAKPEDRPPKGLVNSIPLNSF